MLTLRSLVTAATAGLTALTVALPTVQAAETAPLVDGTYTYGETSEPQTTGATYMTFEVYQGRWVGAFYQPQSAFDCFVGEPDGNRLALTITDSYSEETYSYDVAIARNGQVAAQRGLQTELTLGGLQELSAPSDLDREIIATCREALAD
ncbi:MAG: hypothetical protein HC910_07305 [Spirulinaceae cyanobacterium SM2_1_0]|nr:hypothetical protein [Spirulinaceae cyanobacterium SM2_1_0]